MNKRFLFIHVESQFSYHQNRFSKERIMAIHQNVSIMENLQNIFNYAFVQTSMYYFVFPKTDKYVAVSIPEKLYCCSECGKSFDVKFKNNGVVHIEKNRLEVQRRIYEEQRAAFPDIKAGEPLVYMQPGFCEECYTTQLLEETEPKQAAYNLAKEIYLLDCKFVTEAVELMDAAVLRWLEDKKTLEQLQTYTRANYMAMRNIISAMLADDEFIQRHIQRYQTRFAEQAQCLKACLEQIQDDKFNAVVGKPLNIYESMDDDIYNEYVVVFPADDTPSIEFYTESPIFKERIFMFLEQDRIDSGKVLIQEVGFNDKWIKQIVQHIAQITN